MDVGSGRERTIAGASAAPAEPALADDIEIAASAVVYPGTVLGPGCKIGDGAVVGKQPSLSPRSSTKSEPLPPTVIGRGTIVSTGAIVFAGTRIGERVIVGDQSCVRERVEIDDDVVIGRGVLIENDSTHRREDAATGERLHHQLLDDRGGRLHRPRRADDERQLHGKDGESLRADARPDDPPRRPRRRRSRAAAGSRDRRGGVRRCRRGRAPRRAGRKLVVGNPAGSRDVPEEELLENDEQLAGAATPPGSGRASTTGSRLRLRSGRTARRRRGRRTPASGAATPWPCAWRRPAGRLPRPAFPRRSASCGPDRSDAAHRS